MDYPRHFDLLRGSVSLSIDAGMLMFQAAFWEEEVRNLALHITQGCALAVESHDDECEIRIN